MLEGSTFPGWVVAAPAAARFRPRLVRVARRGPILRPSRGDSQGGGMFGLDLTAGCDHGCVYCHIRGAASFPGGDRVLFDPTTSGRLAAILDSRDRLPSLVALSPTSDPLPPLREVRQEAVGVVRILLDRGIDVVILTRGRIPRGLIDLLADHPERARVAVGLSTLNRRLSRALEPRAAAPRMRLRGVSRLAEAGVRVEVRVEPLIAGLTDTREEVRPLFDALAGAGVRRVLAHYLFLHPAMTDSIAGAMAPLGLAERLQDDYGGGPVFSIGSLGATKHLPIERRREGLARLCSWGAEFGLLVETGASQNPDLHRKATEPETSSRPVQQPSLC